MALILDSGILNAIYDRDDAAHAAALDLFNQEATVPVIPACVLPEVDYFIGKRVGHQAQLDLYRGIVEGYYLVADLSEDIYPRVLELNQQYSALQLGFVDAGVIAVAEELGIGRIATLDRRHFLAVQARIPLTLLP